MSLTDTHHSPGAKSEIGTLVSKRVAGWLLHETNTFAAAPATMAAFVQGGGYIHAFA